MVYRTSCLWYIDTLTYCISNPCLWYFDPLYMLYWTQCLWYFDNLPMVYQTLYMVYQWYIEPLGDDILTPLCMEYGTSFPWYFYPSNLGTSISNTQYLWYFDNLPMVYRIICLCYANDMLTHCLWLFNLSVHEIWNTFDLLPKIYLTACLWYIKPPTFAILNSLPMVFWPPNNGISNTLLMAECTPCLYFDTSTQSTFYIESHAYCVLTPTPFTHRTPCAWYFDPTCGLPTPCLWHTHSILNPC